MKAEGFLLLKGEGLTAAEGVKLTAAARGEKFRDLQGAAG